MALCSVFESSINAFPINNVPLLAELTDEDISSDNFAFMDWRKMKGAGVPARVFRISFTRELSFEINVQANFGLYVWE
jgi:sarcosine oxidase subunit alpha